MRADHRFDEEIRDLIREDAVRGRVYTDPRIFELEMDRVFGRAWLLLGHESQLAEPGAMRTARLGREPVLLVRGRDGAVRGVYNRCPHRGTRLCNGFAARANAIRCPYHGWTFDFDGTLTAIPEPGEYPPDFRFGDHGLSPLPRLESYRGFLFGSADPNAPDLARFLGPMRSSIDDLVDRSPTGRLFASDPPIRHRFKANWKFMFENLNDTVHAGFAHAAATAASRRYARRVGEDKVSRTVGMMLANGKPLSFFQNSEMVVAPWGHSYIGGHIGHQYGGDMAAAYSRALADRHGEERAREILSVDRHLTLLYPGSTWHGRYQTVRVVQPLAPDLTEVTGYVFRLEGAPDEVYRNALEYCVGSTSAASPVITDDFCIYEAAQQANAGTGARWVSLARGIGADEHRANDGSRRARATSEAFIRNQYRAWLDLMTGGAHG